LNEEGKGSSANGSGSSILRNMAYTAGSFRSET
jgi:hypothetical protein